MMSIVTRPFVHGVLVLLFAVAFAGQIQQKQDQRMQCPPDNTIRARRDMTFYVTGSVGNDHYIINGCRDPKFELAAGNKYTWVVSVDETHPFVIKHKDEIGLRNLVSGVQYQGTTKGNIVFEPKQDMVGTHVFYHCANHPGMSGMIEIVKADELQQQKQKQPQQQQRQERQPVFSQQLEKEKKEQQQKQQFKELQQPKQQHQQQEQQKQQKHECPPDNTIRATKDQTFNVTGTVGKDHYIIDGCNDPSFELAAGNKYTWDVNVDETYPFLIKHKKEIGLRNLVGDVQNQGATQGKVVFEPTMEMVGNDVFYHSANHPEMYGMIKVVAGDQAKQKVQTMQATNETATEESEAPTETPTEGRNETARETTGARNETAQEETTRTRNETTGVEDKPTLDPERYRVPPRVLQRQPGGEKQRMSAAVVSSLSGVVAVLSVLIAVL